MTIGQEGTAVTSIVPAVHQADERLDRAARHRGADCAAAVQRQRAAEEAETIRCLLSRVEAHAKHLHADWQDRHRDDFADHLNALRRALEEL